MEQQKVDILIIGAGPAGSTAAAVLAKQGFQVLLVDKYQFPRDKACGDGIINDTIKILSDQNILDIVLQEALVTEKLRIYAPNHSYVTVNGRFITIPRIRFDEILLTNALKNGATFQNLEFKDPIEENNQIIGAIFSNKQDNTKIEIQASITLLATGAAINPLKKFKVFINENSNAFTIRGYFENNDFNEKIDFLSMCYFKQILPGYGWVFPLPRNRFNIGVGYYIGQRNTKGWNIDTLWNKFLNNYPLANQIVKNNMHSNYMKGAFLRTGFKGTKIHKPGFLVIGEAAGLTYPFSGEGIGKAMESATIASNEIIKHYNHKKINVLSLGLSYENNIERNYRKQYDLYLRAQNWLSFPYIANFICWRANNSKSLNKNIEDLINEEKDPRSIFSIISLTKSFFS